MLQSYFVLTCLLIIVVTCENIIDYHVYGVCDPRWQSIYDLFRDNFASERDLGAGMTIYHRGRLVVGLTGGWFDASKTKPYDDQTLQLVFSTSKGIVATAVALVVQYSLLDYSALVTQYWPEYGQNGKENTTVADILSHRAGLPDVIVSFDQYLNWTTMIETLEKQSPSWPPGSAYSYHPLTYGWLAGELVRRVDPKRRSFGQFVLDEIATPLSLEFYFGLPITEAYRVSPLELNQASINLISQSIHDNILAYNQGRVHEAEIPAVNGITSAKSLARLYYALIDDFDDGKSKRILDDPILKLAIQSNTLEGELDLVSNTYSPFGMGFMLFDQLLPKFRSKVFGHFGAGGSVGLAIPAHNLSFAYVMNRLDVTSSTLDPRVTLILDRIADLLN